MAKEPVTLEFLGVQIERALLELAAIRRDMANVITLSTQNLEYSRRLERRVGETEQSVNNVGRRIDELKDDLELMLKGEIAGRLSNFESRIERKITQERDDH